MLHVCTLSWCHHKCKSVNKGVLGDFQAWSEACNKLVPEDPVPVNLFEPHDADLLCKGLCYVQNANRNQMR